MMSTLFVNYDFSGAKCETRLNWAKHFHANSHVELIGLIGHLHRLGGGKTYSCIVNSTPISMYVFGNNGILIFDNIKVNFSIVSETISVDMQEFFLDFDAEIVKFENLHLSTLVHEDDWWKSIKLMRDIEVELFKRLQNQ